MHIKCHTQNALGHWLTRKCKHHRQVWHMTSLMNFHKRTHLNLQLKI